MRLAQVVRRGRPWSACRMAVSNPLINSYFLFTLLMFYIYVRVENRFGAEGRNWLPMLLPIFLVGLTYAPKALTLRPSRIAMSRLVLCGLLLYGIAGSYYALHTLKKRYYVSGHRVTVMRTRRDDGGVRRRDVLANPLETVEKPSWPETHCWWFVAGVTSSSGVEVVFPQGIHLGTRRRSDRDCPQPWPSRGQVARALA